MPTPPHQDAALCSHRVSEETLLQVASFTHPTWMRHILDGVNQFSLKQGSFLHRLHFLNTCIECNQIVLDAGGDVAEECAEGRGRLTLTCGHVMHLRCCKPTVFASTMIASRKNTEAGTESPSPIFCFACREHTGVPLSALSRLPVPLPLFLDGRVVSFYGMYVDAESAQRVKTARDEARARAEEVHAARPWAIVNAAHAAEQRVVHEEAVEETFELQVNDSGRYIETSESRAVWGAVCDPQNHQFMAHAAFFWADPRERDGKSPGCLELCFDSWVTFHACFMSGIFIKSMVTRRVSYKVGRCGPFTVVRALVNGRVKWAYATLTVYWGRLMRIRDVSVHVVRGLANVADVEATIHPECIANDGDGKDATLLLRLEFTPFSTT